METFAFIAHPHEVRVRGVVLEPPALKRLHARAVEGLMRFVPPFPASRITGVRSRAGGETEGWIVSCPLTLRQMDTYSGEFLRRKVMQGLNAARRVGAKVVGVGMVDAIFARRRIQVDYGSGVRVTTGRGLAIGSGLKGLVIAAHEAAEVDPVDARIVVLGAATATGIACSRLLAKGVRYLALVDFQVESAERLRAIAARLLHETGLAARVALPGDPGFRDVIERADILIVASDIASEQLAGVMRELRIRRGALIFRIFPGRDVSRAAADAAASPLNGGGAINDGGARCGYGGVHVMDDAVLQIPGDFRMDPPIELPIETGSPYVVEPMILALEGVEEADNLPPQGDIAFARWVEEVTGLAEKHGFVVTGAKVNGQTISRGVRGGMIRGTMMRGGMQDGHAKCGYAK
ncbi:MAG: hypothetical protein HPY71_00225 [Firmicutes bacterium]|nr:hypothetical protein [Bacillota bacterium]